MNQFLNKVSSVLRIFGFSILSAFFGVGVAWILVAIAARISRNHGIQILTGSMPILLLGGVVGFITGLVISLRVAKASLKTKAKIEEKYVSGRGGRARIYNTLPIYFGGPMLIIAISIPLIDRLTPILGIRSAVYVHLGFVLAILATSLFVYDRIPKKLIIPIGIIGWLLTLLLAVCFAFYTLR